MGSCHLPFHLADCSKPSTGKSPVKGYFLPKDHASSSGSVILSPRKACSNLSTSHTGDRKSLVGKESDTTEADLARMRRQYLKGLQITQPALLWLPRWLSSKEPACQCSRRHRFNPWVGTISWREEMANPLQYSCLENSLDRGV